MTDALFAALKLVNGEASFTAFARALLADREAADGVSVTFDGLQSEWANNFISSFIEGAIGWADDFYFAAPLARSLQIPGFISPNSNEQGAAMNSALALCCRRPPMATAER